MQLSQPKSKYSSLGITIDMRTRVQGLCDVLKVSGHDFSEEADIDQAVPFQIMKTMTEHVEAERPTVSEVLYLYSEAKARLVLSPEAFATVVCHSGIWSYDFVLVLRSFIWL